MADRCTGHCCKHFFLNFTPETLERSAGIAQARKAWREVHADPTTGTLSSSVDVLYPDHLRWTEFGEVEKIADLAIYLGRTHPVTGNDAGEEAGFYTCRHLQENGDCGIHATRPRMCREYPYGHACEWGKSCEWDAAREGKAGGCHRAILPTENLDGSVTIHLKVLGKIEAHMIEHVFEESPLAPLGLQDISADTCSAG